MCGSQNQLPYNAQEVCNYLQLTFAGQQPVGHLQLVAQHESA